MGGKPFIQFYRSIGITLVCLCAACCPLAAQTPDFIFDHYATAQGLPHNSISDLHRDSKGYLWASTWNGLSRFDGSNFVAYTIRPGDRTNLSHNRILTIDEDVHGFLWLTTYDNRLYRFDPVQETFVAIPDDLGCFEQKNLKVSCFHNHSQGCTWFSVPGKGLYKMDKDLQVTPIPGAGPVQEAPTRFYEDRAGQLFAVSAAGLLSVNEAGAQLRYPAASPFIDFAQLGGQRFFLSETQLVILDAAEGSRPRVVDLGERATALCVTGAEGAEALYIGLARQAIGRYDLANGTLRRLSHPMGRVRLLFPDPQGLVWICTDQCGIWTWDPERETFKHHVHSRNVMSYYTDTLARVVSCDGHTWVKMNQYGFGYYDRQHQEVVPLHNVPEQADCRFMNGVACFEPEASGVLWFSTIKRGLDRVMLIKPKAEVLRPPTQAQDEHASAEIRAMLRDRKGQLWVAAKSRELYRYSPDLQSCRRFPDAASGDIGVVYAIFEDREGRLWLGTKGDGLVCMCPDPDGKHYSYRRWRHEPGRPESLSSDDIYAITQDPAGRIWVATFGHGPALLEDPQGDTFVTVYNGLQGYPTDFANRARSLHTLADGTLLVGTVGGLVWFDPLANPPTFKSARKIPGDPHSLGNNDIIQIFADGRGETWLCTFGGGLDRVRFVDGEPVFDNFCQADGLASDIVLTGVPDREGCIWMSTEEGISKLDPRDGSIYNYTRYHGIAPTLFSEATGAMAADGSILLGSLNHIYRLKPTDFGHETDSCGLTITGLRINGDRVPLTACVEVPHDYSSVHVHFAALRSRLGDERNFQYMLEGYDKDWLPAGEGHSVTYTRIPPGTYTFKVQRLLSHKGEAGEVATQKIRVAAAPWLSTPAKWAYGILALAIVAFLIRLLAVQVKLRNDVKVEQDLGKVKARFFTHISHELRTPLTLILGGVDELRKEKPGDQNYTVNLVYRNAKRMMTLVNQLLDVRKIVDGKMRLKVKQLDIVDLVKRVYADFKEMSSERHIELRLTHSEDALPVWGDELRLEALVYNLVSNAFKFTADGGLIELGLFHREGEKDFTIMVKDNGIGIPKEKQAVIFEPFVQAADTVLKGVAGSGIGLSFCKEITQMHGGRIWVESRKHEGACFYVKLPIDRDRFSEETAEFLELNQVKQPAGTAQGADKGRVAPSHPANALKLLVVEDNAELRLFLYNHLCQKYEVREAPQGKEALTLIAQGWSPDLILTDLMMPVMDGIALINAVRNDFAISHIPIILFTAKYGNDTHLQAMQYGADGYITKPFTMDLLQARIDNLLARRQRILSHLTRFSEVEAGEGKKGKVAIVPQEIVITDRDEALIQKVMQWLEAHVADAEVTVDQMAAYVGMGRTSMYNKLKGLTGKSPVELIQSYRIEKASLYLKSGQYSVSETSYKVGFSDPGYFSRSFKNHMGLSPADYMKQHARTAATPPKDTNA